MSMRTWLGFAFCACACACMGAETFSVPAGETFELDVFDAVGTNVADNVVELNEGATLKLVKSELVGEMVMERLKDLDEVAYVRFASVYRSFKDIGSFRRELENLENEKQSQ